MNIKKSKTAGRLFRLSSANKLLLLKAVFLAVLINLGKRLFRFKTLMTFLDRRHKDAALKNPDCTELENYRRLIILTDKLRPVTGINCLDISAAFWLLMKRKGIKTDFKLGTRMDGNQFQSHAWLEYNGISLTIDPLIRQGYNVFDNTIL